MSNTHSFSLTGLVAVGLLFLACLSPADAGVFRCTDKNNRTYYQDKPCQDLIATRLPSSLARLAGREEERAFMWKAVGDKATLYLLGALQYGMQSLNLPQMVSEAFNNSASVIVEADVNNYGDKELAALLKGKGRYEDKTKSLETAIKSTTWNMASEMGKKLKINEEVLSQYKPWMAAILLTSESLKQAGYNPELGLSQTFIKASQGKKPVTELENVDEQIKMFEGFSSKVQEQMLLQALQELGRAPDIYKNKADAWRKGDVEAMDMLVRQSYDLGQPTSQELFKAIYEDRNERIVNWLKDNANEDKSYFVVVGAGRLGGDKGILRLLQDKGFKVTQP